MNSNRLIDSDMFIQSLIPLQEGLLEYHFKITAMLEVLLFSDLTEHSRVTLHDFLWGISDMMEQAQTLNEGILDRLLKPMNEPPTAVPGAVVIH